MLGSARRFRLDALTYITFAPSGKLFVVTGISVGFGVGVAGGAGVAASSGGTVGSTGAPVPPCISTMPG